MIASWVDDALLATRPAGMAAEQIIDAAEDAARAIWRESRSWTRSNRSLAQAFARAGGSLPSPPEIPGHGRAANAVQGAREALGVLNLQPWSPTCSQPRPGPSCLVRWGHPPAGTCGTVQQRPGFLLPFRCRLGCAEVLPGDYETVGKAWTPPRRGGRLRSGMWCPLASWSPSRSPLSWKTSPRRPTTGSASFSP